MAKKKHIEVKPHFRKPPGPRMPSAPSVGPNEFDAGQEQAMRAGQRQANMPPMGDNDGDEGMGGMGGL